MFMTTPQMGNATPYWTARAKARRVRLCEFANGQLLVACCGKAHLDALHRAP